SNQRGQSRPVLNESADVPQRHLRKSGITVPSKERLPALPQRLVGVHATAVVLENRLGHEGYGLAVLIGDVLDNVFVKQHVVGGVDQRIEFQVDFGLTAGRDFVVMAFN